MVLKNGPACPCPPEDHCRPGVAPITPVVSVKSVNGFTGDVVLKSLTVGNKSFNGSDDVEIKASDLGLEKAWKYQKSVSTKAKVEELIADASVGDTYYCTEDKLFYLSVGEGDYKTFTSSSAVLDALEEYSKISETGNKLNITIDELTYELTVELLDKNNNVLSSKSIDLPIEELVKDAKYDKAKKALIITFQGGKVVEIPLTDLTADLVTKDEMDNAISDVKTEVASQYQKKLTAGEGIEISTDNVISSTASGKLSEDFTTNITVGGIPSGTKFVKGTSLESILKMMLYVQKTLTGISITTPPTKTSYIIGEKFDTSGMVVTATYNNGSTQVITNYTYSPTSALSLADTKITVSYTEDGVTKTTEQAITVATDEILLYKGATNNIPSDLTGLTKISGKTASDLKNNGLVQTIDATIDPETEEGQWVVLAVGSAVTLTKWENTEYPGGMEFTTVNKDTYKLYYLNSKVTTSISYTFTFE